MGAMETISKQTLARLPLYLHYLRSRGDGASAYVSASGIAEAMGLNPVQVRKDLAQVSTSGRPKVGYVSRSLAREIEAFLGYDNANDAVIVGAGRLGRALLGYGGFAEYGLNILAAFDIVAAEGETEAGKPVLPMEKLGGLCRRLGVRIGIVTTPGDAAQEACDALIRAGVLAIWNFAPVRLAAPEGVLVQNENMASSLAILSNHLSERLEKGVDIQ